ncbi:MAG TPA: 3-hydroxyacyl-ACP dehydratase FabZ family protein [Gemmataceae bacterium]|nr:3-hydroxyacyl-ACP dehydratase FabZ family protein [Gemmataceae bacterium]
MPPVALFDATQVDFSHVVADCEAIRRVNPQRFEMEQLTAIVYLDRDQNLIVGYKDVGADEFWVRGHMPGYPLFPGVLMCEAGAQLCSYFCHTAGLLQGDFIGFGGLENVQFRGPVHPGDRFVLVAKAQKLHRRKTVFNVQGFVGSTMVFNGDIIGVPMSRQSSAVAGAGGEEA